MTSDPRHPEISLQHAAVNGLRLHYASCGDKGQPLVIFLHGFPEFWYAWRDQLLDFGCDHFAVAPDLRGINRSDKPAQIKSYRVTHAAADVVALAEHLGYQDFLLVGHDWGGAVAFALAIAQPERVRRLALLNAVHPGAFAEEMVSNATQQQASAYINLFRRADAAEISSRDDYAALRTMFAEGGEVPAWFGAEARARYIDAWSQPGALDGGLNYYRASPLHPPTADDPGAAAALARMDLGALRVRVPTLILWGDRDRYLLRGCADAAARHIEDLRVVHFPEATHWIAHEEPQRVNRLLREHFAP